MQRWTLWLSSPQVTQYKPVCVWALTQLFGNQSQLLCGTYWSLFWEKKKKDMTAQQKCASSFGSTSSSSMYWCRLSPSPPRECLWLPVCRHWDKQFFSRRISVNLVELETMKTDGGKQIVFFRRNSEPGFRALTCNLLVFSLSRLRTTIENRLTLVTTTQKVQAARRWKPSSRKMKVCCWVISESQITSSLLSFVFTSSDCIRLLLFLSNWHGGMNWTVGCTKRSCNTVYFSPKNDEIIFFK